jgi:hypothetical protein
MGELMHDVMGFNQLADGDDFHIWMVAENTPVLNKKSQTANKGWSSSLGVGRGLTTGRPKKSACYEKLQGVSGFTDSCEHSNKPSDFTKGGKFFDQLSDCAFFIKNNAP